MPLSLSVSVNKNSKILALFAISCTFCVGIVNLLTEDKVIEQRHKKLLTTLTSVIEPSRFDNNLALDCTIANDPLLGSDKAQTIYLARMNDKPIAAAVTAIAPNGYNGAITLLIAVNFDGSVSGVRTLSHQETPGLGDKIELKKSLWITSFEGKTLSNDNINRWSVIKDGGMFDQFTGATITPRAVVQAVKNATLYIQENKLSLFTASNACQILVPIEKPVEKIQQKQSSEALEQIFYENKTPDNMPRIDDKSTASASADNEK